MSEFIQNLFNAMFVIAQVLEDITFTVNNATISFMDMTIYGAIISLVIYSIRESSKNGLFTFGGNKEKESSDNGS